MPFNRNAIPGWITGRIENEVMQHRAEYLRDKSLDPDTDRLMRIYPDGIIRDPMKIEEQSSASSLGRPRYSDQLDDQKHTYIGAKRITTTYVDSETGVTMVKEYIDFQANQVFTDIARINDPVTAVATPSSQSTTVRIPAAVTGPQVQAVATPELTAAPQAATAKDAEEFDEFDDDDDDYEDWFVMVYELDGIVYTTQYTTVPTAAPTVPPQSILAQQTAAAFLEVSLPGVVPAVVAASPTPITALPGVVPAIVAAPPVSASTLPEEASAAAATKESASATPSAEPKAPAPHPTEFELAHMTEDGVRLLKLGGEYIDARERDWSRIHLSLFLNVGYTLADIYSFGLTEADFLPESEPMPSAVPAAVKEEPWAPPPWEDENGVLRYPPAELPDSMAGETINIELDDENKRIAKMWYGLKSDRIYDYFPNQIDWANSTYEYYHTSGYPFVPEVVGIDPHRRLPQEFLGPITKKDPGNFEGWSADDPYKREPSFNDQCGGKLHLTCYSENTGPCCRLSDMTCGSSYDHCRIDHCSPRYGWCIQPGTEKAMALTVKEEMLAEGQYVREN